MAKRRSEPLALGSSPCPRFLPQKRSRRELEPPWGTRWLVGGGSQKRKREESIEPPGGGRRRGNNGDQEEEEEVTVNCERPSSSSSEECAKEKKGQARLCSASLKPEEGASKRISPTQDQEENEDDVWRYNSFQYWRSPLPTIHLSDILDLENNKAVDERESSSIGMSEMET